MTVLVDHGFIGRSEELATFERALLAARAGAPSLVLVGGDAGIGKSSLVNEAARRSAGRCLIAPCVRMGGEQIPLAPLMALLRRLQRADPALLDTAPVLRDWIEPQAGASVRHSDVLASATDLVVAASEASPPLLFVVEDAHWADVATWDLVDDLARNLVDESIVVAVTYRTVDANLEPELRRRIAELARLPHVSRLALDGWTLDEVAHRIETMIGAPPSAGLISEIVRRGQGNPYFTQELVTARQADVDLPDVVSELVETDLHRLPAASRNVVAALAVIGRPADQDLVVAVAELDDDAEGAIQAAIDAGLVIVEGDTFHTRHALIAEVVYQRLLPGERRRRHRLAAGALQGRLSGHHRADQIGELAVHLDRSGDIAASYSSRLAAADAAEAVAPAAALDHLLRAIELWPDVGDGGDAEIIERLWQAADLANGTRGNELAVELAQRALDAGLPPRGWAWGHERLGRYLWSAGRVGDSAAEYVRAYELVAESTDDEHLAPVLAGLGQAELMHGNYQAAEACSRRALENLSGPEHDLMAWVTANRVLGIAVSHQGDPDAGIALCQRSVDAAPSAHVRHLASIYLVLAQLAAGRYDDAAHTALDASADAVRSGADRSFSGYLDALAAEALIRLGRWTEADRLLRRHTRGDTVPVGEVRLLIAEAKLCARRGEAAAAEALLRTASAIPIDAWHQTYLTAGIADVELVAGRWQEAADAARRGLELPAGSRLLWRVRFTNLLVNAEVERLLDAVAVRDEVDVHDAVRALEAMIGDAREAVHRHDTGQLPEVIAYLDHATASIGLLTGSNADTWQRVGDQWAALSDAWSTSVCRLREAEAAASVGEARRAEAALRAAHEIAARLGSPPLLAQIDAVSRRTRINVDRPELVVLSDTTAERLGLTARETEVLTLIAGGATNREIGQQLYISEKTASVHVSNILRKLGVTTRVEAAAVAQRLGLDEPPAELPAVPAN